MVCLLCVVLLDSVNWLVSVERSLIRRLDFFLIFDVRCDLVIFICAIWLCWNLTNYFVENFWQALLRRWVLARRIVWKILFRGRIGHPGGSFIRLRIIVDSLFPSPTWASLACVHIVGIKLHVMWLAITWVISWRFSSCWWWLERVALHVSLVFIERWPKATIAALLRQ